MINARLFIISMILATIAGISESPGTWLIITHIYPTDPTLMYIILAPIQLVLTVFLPFFIMYTLPMNVDSKDQFKLLLISIFLGCFIGSLIAFGINAYLIYRIGATFGSFISTIFQFAWGIVKSAFSGVLFVSIAAVLLAYYLKHEDVLKS